MTLTIKFTYMKNVAKISGVVFLFLLFFCVACKNSDSNKETVLKGTTTILVDETLKPVIEDQILVFESKYDAKIVMDAKSEKEVIQALIKDTSAIAILTRSLTDSEKKIFEAKKILPKITPIGTDAIAFISNKKAKDTLISLQKVINFMQGKSEATIKGLVFDNPNSSTVRYVNDLSGIKELPKNGVFSFKTNEEVIKFVAENDEMIGVVGVNWLMQPSSEMAEIVKNINVLSVQGIGAKEYILPTQNNIAEGTYPLARDLYIINCQGYSGLGMGFASFVAGDIGQRIILKSGLLPVRIPGRKIIIKNDKNNDKE